MKASGKKLLSQTPVGSLILEQDVPYGIVSVSKLDSISHAFKQMIDKKILSVPVYDPIKHHFESFIDMVDIVSFCVERLPQEELTNGDLSSLMESAKEFKTVNCGQIADISKRNQYCPVESTAPLRASIELMAKWSVHRVPVVDAGGDLITILTQSRVIKYIHQHMNMFEDIAGRTLESLRMIHEGVISIPHRSLTIEAFKAIHDKKVSAVAVVDNDGKLVGNVSASDLKVVGYDGALLSRLFYPISQFLKILPHEHKEALKIEGPVCVKPSATFREVIDKLVNIRIHRLYVVDDNQIPIGVVSQLEVLGALLSVML